MRSLTAVASIWILASVVMAEKSWPEFRGPHGDGHAQGASLPVAIDQSVVRWETPIHGKGWSSPVVWGDQIWLTTATEDGTKMSVICVDRATGKVIHDKVLLENTEPAFCHPMNSYATPTPVIEAGRVYVHFGSYLTACLDTETAEVLWERRDLKCDHHRGPASSPILDGEKLFVAYDGFDVQYVVALDKQTGETIWKRDRQDRLRDRQRRPQEGLLHGPSDRSRRRQTTGLSECRGHHRVRPRDGRNACGRSITTE